MSRLSRRARVGGALLVVALTGLVAVPAANAQPSRGQRVFQLNNSGAAQVAAKPDARKARTVALPYRNAKSAKALAASAARTTVQTWSSAVGAGQDGHNYPFTLVGKDVRTPATPTKVKTFVIPVIWTFTATGDVYDPTVANTSCGETQSDLSGTLNGPVFKKHKYKSGPTVIGTTQYIDSLQRGEFWLWTNPAGANPNYHVLLNGSSPVAVYVNANGFPEYAPGTCNAVGEVDIGTWDSFLQGSLFPALAAHGVSPTTFPIFLFKNVVLYNGSTSNCCILGYHSAFNNPNFGGNAQTYGISEYDTSGSFTNVADNSVLSHEVGEWANDPYVNNPTPSWGHTGQVSGCQANLEVGDPLSGTIFPVAIAGTTYHLQELAFFGWFFDFNSGVNGLYSTRGTFKTGASLCS